MTPPLGSRCVTCWQPFTASSWIDRNTTSDTETYDHDLEPGDHHETCCPICNRDGEATR